MFSKIYQCTKKSSNYPQKLAHLLQKLVNFYLIIWQNLNTKKKLECQDTTLMIFPVNQLFLKKFANESISGQKKLKFITQFRKLLN